MVAHSGILERANQRAQRRFRAMLDAQAYPDPQARETVLYVQAERTVDAVMLASRVERLKAEWDALLAVDHDYHELTGIPQPNTCDTCLEVTEDVPEPPYNVDAWTEAENREAWGR
jgi:hypothetical protein